MSMGSRFMRRLKPARIRDSEKGVRLLSPKVILALLWLAAVGCGASSEHFGQIVSLRWRINFPRPAGVSVATEKGNFFMYSKGGDWTLSLSVRKPFPGRGESDRFKSEKWTSIIDDMRRRVAALRGGHWRGAEILKIRGATGFRFDFEGPADDGQASLPFIAGEHLFQRVSVIGKGDRIYLLHLRARPGAKKNAIREWNILFRGIRFTGPVGIAFPGTEQVPEGSMNSLLREALAEK